MGLGAGKVGEEEEGGSMVGVGINVDLSYYAESALLIYLYNKYNSVNIKSFGHILSTLRNDSIFN